MGCIQKKIDPRLYLSTRCELRTTHVGPAPSNAQALYLKQHKCDVLLYKQLSGSRRLPDLYFFPLHIDLVLRVGHLCRFVSLLWLPIFVFVLSKFIFFAAFDEYGCVLSLDFPSVAVTLVAMYIASIVHFFLHLLFHFCPT